MFPFGYENIWLTPKTCFTIFLMAWLLEENSDGDLAS